MKGTNFVGKTQQTFKNVKNNRLNNCDFVLGKNTKTEVTSKASLEKERKAKERTRSKTLSKKQ